MAASWEGKKYGFGFSTLGSDGLTDPPNYEFRLQRTLVTEDQYYYTITPDPENPPGDNPFSKRVLLPQKGRPLIHYLKSKERLDPGADSYLEDLEELINEIVHTKIEPEPNAFERLVGFLEVDDLPVNPVTFYRVENTHKDGKLLLIVQLKLADQSPGGSIGAIAR